MLRALSFFSRDLIRAFYCPVCKAGFDDKITLALHLRRKHWCKEKYENL